MFLRKGKTLHLPLTSQLVGLGVRRKGPWNTPSLTCLSSYKCGRPDAEIWSHLPKVTELRRGKARVSLSPEWSTA